MKKAADLKNGGQEPGREVAGRVSRSQVKEIATNKMVDLNANTIEAAMRMVEGSARSMGLAVVD